MSGLGDAASRALAGFAAVCVLVGLVAVVWDGWDRWQNRRWERKGR